MNSPKQYYLYDKSSNLINKCHQKLPVSSNSNRLLNTAYDRAGNQLIVNKTSTVHYNFQGQVAWIESSDKTEYYTYTRPGKRLRKVQLSKNTSSQITALKLTQYLNNTEFRKFYKGLDLSYNGFIVLENNKPTFADEDFVTSRINIGLGQIAKICYDQKLGVNQYIYNLINNIDSNSVELISNSQFKSLQNFYPFGALNKNAGNTDRKELGYSGEELDDTGLNYFGFRYYDSNSGRWTQTDPSKTAGSELNWYAFLKGNPITFKDEYGLCTFNCINDCHCNTIFSILFFTSLVGMISMAIADAALLSTNPRAAKTLDDVLWAVLPTFIISSVVFGALRVKELRIKKANGEYSRISFTYGRKFGSPNTKEIVKYASSLEPIIDQLRPQLESVHRALSQSATQEQKRQLAFSFLSPQILNADQKTFEDFKNNVKDNLTKMINGLNSVKWDISYIRKCLGAHTQSPRCASTPKITINLYNQNHTQFGLNKEGTVFFFIIHELVHATIQRDKSNTIHHTHELNSLNDYKLGFYKVENLPIAKLVKNENGRSPAVITFQPPNNQLAWDRENVPEIENTLKNPDSYAALAYLSLGINTLNSLGNSQNSDSGIELQVMSSKANRTNKLGNPLLDD